jgi:hypothetical protein
MTGRIIPGHARRAWRDDLSMRAKLARPTAVLLLAGAAVGFAGCPAARTPPTARSARTAAKENAAPAGANDADGGAVPLLPPGAWRNLRPRRDPSDLCEPVRENLDRSADAILAAAGALNEPATAANVSRATPKYMDLVDRRFALTRTEKTLLQQRGFVVPARLEQRGYAAALHEIYQSQLPIYVSADAILGSVFKANDAILERTEAGLSARLDDVLRKMHGALGRAAADYPPDVARDLDLYLTVARALLAGEEASIAPALGQSGQIDSLLRQTRAADGGLATLSLFGRARVVDFSQYAPRGHYVHSDALQHYFQASMWLSRLEWNLVSRASRSSQPGIVPNPEETPREAVDALAIADLADRAAVLGDLDVLDRAWRELAGKREDVSIRELLSLRAKAGIGALTAPDAADRLKAAIGPGFVRTARLHYMPQGSTPLPVIATMLGPRVVADTQVETNLVHARIDGRPHPSFADVAFLFGEARADTWLAQDRARYPALGAELEAGRRAFASVGPTDLYAAWFAAVRGLSASPEGSVPSFMKTTAFEDLRVNSTVAAYGQLRHNYVLIAGQAYDEGGCEVPDGYVDPALAVYEGLVAYAARGRAAMDAIGGPKEATDYFARLEKVMRVLVAITKDELAGRTLTEEQKRWLSMVVEIVPPSSDGPGSNDGWYFDLFLDVGDAFTSDAFVADWFTSSNARTIVYAGATAPRLGLFVVDTGGEPRVVVGPVTRAFEHHGDPARRLRDDDVGKINLRSAEGGRHPEGALNILTEPWAASYTAPAPAAPPLAVVNLPDDGSGTGEPTAAAFAVRGSPRGATVTLELLDHHRQTLGRATATVDGRWQRVRVRAGSMNPDAYAEVLRIRVGDFSREVSLLWGLVNEGMGGIAALPEGDVWQAQERLAKRLAH